MAEILRRHAESAQVLGEAPPRPYQDMAVRRRSSPRAVLVQMTFALLIGLLAGSVIACRLPAASGASSVGGRELVVFAAASLTEPFNEIAGAFSTENSGARVAFNFGGSNGLRTQLEQGARADVFASADQLEMDRAIAAGLVSGQPAVFARNRLVVVVPRSNPGRIERLRDLARPGVKLVVAHRNVPVGTYTIEMLDKMSADPAFGVDFKGRVLSNVVSEETNVKQVAAKVQLGEADAGVVYSSDVTPKLAPEVRTVDVPDAFNVVATYPIAVLNPARQPELARRFVDFVLSDAGQQILKKHNFVPVGSP